jgi:hypothetical protein
MKIAQIGFLLYYLTDLKITETLVSRKALNRWLSWGRGASRAEWQQSQTGNIVSKVNIFRILQILNYWAQQQEIKKKWYFTEVHNLC